MNYKVKEREKQMKKIYVVTEDKLGNLSYWKSRKKAYREARKVLSCNIKARDYFDLGTKRINELIRSDFFPVRIFKVTLNKSWG